MDDMDDDERYPPNSHHQRGHFSSSSSSSFARPNRIPPPQISRHHPPAVDEDDEEDEDAANGVSGPIDEDNDEDVNETGGGGGGGRGYRHVTADGRGSLRDHDDGGDEYSSSGSSESRGKRRKIDRGALGFEFAPRVPPQAAAPAKPPARSSTTDWSEDATYVLLDAWGNRYVQNGRKSIRSDEWSEVAKIVSQASKVSRSDGQCRNRVDTLKKKYKKEKTRLAADHGDSSSKWIYFQRMDALMSPPSPPPSSIGRQRQHHQSPKLACGVDAGEYVFAGYQNRVNGNDEMRDSPGDTGTDDDGDDDEDDSEGLPPSRKNAPRTSDSSFRILADSIQKFGEIYEKMENSKRQQMAELEQMRKEFHRDLELQKKQILERAQAEIAKLREEEGEEGDDEDDDDDDADDDTDDNSGSADNLSG